jgi:hypothetical protein
MPVETNFNVSPYFDDYNEQNNFHRVLFKPGVAVQARELSQLQTILQNQVERFGDNIFKTGTIIKGCSLTTDYNYDYIKIKDQQNNGVPVNLALYSNTLVVQEASNLHAIVVNYISGFQSTDPDLNTLYIKYQNTGTTGEKTYALNDTIKIFDRARTVESVTINNGGTLYTNGDVVTFTGGSGTGATATITTDSTGEIVDVSMLTKGTGYTSVPNTTITTTSGVSANLTAVTYIAELSVANSSFTSPVGTGTAIKSTEGIIYQKGHFIRVDAQEKVIEKYSNQPSNVVVGFFTSEGVSNSNNDSTLLDNATGTPNFTAPGADRLKLTPLLQSLTTSEAEANNDFLALLEYQEGKVVRDRTRTQYNYIGKELSKRTFEESGNYVLNTIALNTADRASNTSHIDLLVGAGIAYVNGERVELLNSIKVPVRKGNDTANSINQTINTLYGSYVVIKEMLGAFDIKAGTSVNLMSAASTDVTDNAGGTPTAAGSVIGTAKVRSIIFDSGVQGTPTATYKLFLFDINMSTGKAFNEARGIALGTTAVADIVLNAANKAVLEDIENDILVFNTGAFAVKTLTQEEFIFRTSSNSTLSTSGTDTITFSGGNTLPYGAGALTDTAKQEFIIVPTQSFRHQSNNNGTVSANTNQSNVVGTSTAFTTQYTIGDYIVIGNSAPNRIETIYNDSLLGLSGNFTGLGGATANAVANAHYTGYPANVPIDFTKDGKSITIDSSTGITIDIGATTNATATYVMYHDLENFEPSVRVKTLNNPIFVKLSTDRVGADLNGPWCIGVPDVLNIEAVYVGTGNTYSESSTNFASEFELVNGQKDNIYGLGYIKKSPGSTLNLTSNSCLLVKVRSFTHSSGKYISTESYPVDDTTSVLPSNKIRTQDIPVYVSETSGEAFSLRDCIDFRPIVANTATLSSTSAGATVDPSATETLIAGEKFFPSPTKQFECTIEYYLSRRDRIVVGQDGRVRIIEGVPGIEPLLPSSERGTMDLGIINIAPFPSLSAKASAAAKRHDLKNTINLLQTRRYTMKDISGIESRLQRLEYYALLSTLEANTKNLTIPSDANSEIEVFKNGFFVDPFNNYTISNLDDGEYKALVDTNRSRLIPQRDVVNFELAHNSSSSVNTTRTGNLITLNYNEVDLISQPKANKERTLVEQNYSFIGKMLVVPRVDNFFDTDVTATSAIDINIADPLNALIEAQNQINSQLSSSTELLSTANVGGAVITGTTRGRNWERTTFSQDIQTTFGDTQTQIDATAPVVTSQQELGTFLTSVNVTPFIRPQKIAVHISGLRPGAQHYVFFDGEDLTANSIPATLSDFNNITLNSFKPDFNKLASPGLFANSSGELGIIIDIPANTFTTGEKDILVMDVSSLISEESATSKGKGRFAAFALQGTSTTVTVSTSNFDLSEGSFIANTFTETRVVNSSISWTRTRTWDPLAQTFIVQKQKGDGDVIFLTSVDIYFKQKDLERGVTLELREVNETGYPTPLILPFSTVYKKSNQVSTSNTAAVATTFTFSSPVAVKVDKEYAIVLTPDANSPDYRVWTAIPGIADVTNPALVANESWGLGTLFFSTSNRAFSPVQSEDLKFAVRRAEFNPSSGSVVLNNADYEFLTVNAISGSFRGGESVVQLSQSYLNSTFTTNTSSPIIGTSSSLTSSVSTGDYLTFIYGTSESTATANVKATGTTVSNSTSTTTDFEAEYSVGDFIKIGSEVRQVISVASNTSLTVDAAFNGSITNQAHYTVTPKYDVLNVLSANSTAITVNRPPSYAVSGSLAASAQKAVRGSVAYYNSSKGSLHLKDSTAANSNFLIKTSNSTFLGYLIGDDTDTVATVASIDNIPGTIFTSLINTLIVPGTAVNFSATFTKLGGGTDTQTYTIGGTNVIDINDSAIVKSKSNEISGGTVNKSFTATLTLSTAYDDTTPVVDIVPSSIVVSKYNINNSSANENTRYGAAQAKYISKRLTLNEGLDAEDIKVYLRAFKPAGTDIEVYAKVLNSADAESFNDKDWSQLQLVTSASLFSSSLNENDLREYEYTFKKSPTSVAKAGKVSVSTSSTTVTGSGTDFQADFAQGDLIKLIQSSATDSFDIIPVASVASNTSLTLVSNASFTASGVEIEKITRPKEAFKYNRNNYIVRYFDSAGGAHDSYKYLAIKIVLKSNYTYLVPQVDDVRTIAVSI